MVKVLGVGKESEVGGDGRFRNGGEGDVKSSSDEY